MVNEEKSNFTPKQLDEFLGFCYYFWVGYFLIPFVLKFRMQLILLSSFQTKDIFSSANLIRKLF